MGLYVGNSGKVKIIINNVEYYLHFFSKTPIINGVRLLSSDRYILKSSDRLYLTAKEEE